MSEIKTQKKKRSFFAKVIIIFALAIVGYASVRYWQFTKLQKLNAQAEISKFDNIESEIFDLTGDDKNQDAEHLDESRFSDISLTELKEGGAEFIYQLLLKNQVQIGDLKSEVHNLKFELNKYKSHEKARKIIFTYIDLREKIYNGDNFSRTLKSFEAATITDKVLQKKIDLLKPALQKFYGSKIISKNFTKLIPGLIAMKTNDPNASLVKKIRHNIAKLVVIRKLNPAEQSIDGIVKLTEDYLQNEDYINALEAFYLLGPSYQEISPEFLEELKAAAEIQKIDEEILLYLRDLV